MTAVHLAQRTRSASDGRTYSDNPQALPDAPDEYIEEGSVD